MNIVATETDRSLARLVRLVKRMEAETDEAKYAELDDERDELVSTLLGELADRHADERDLWVRWNEALLRRDVMVRDLMAAKVSPSAVAYAIRSDRTWPYTIAQTVDKRLAEWPEKRDKRR